MIIPSRQMCDFCGQEITGRPYTKLTIPISRTLQQEIADGYRETMQARPKSIGLSFDLFFSTGFVPNAWELHQCVGCTAAGVMPDAMGKVCEQIRATIDARIATARRAASALEDLEPEPSIEKE